jgi:hypothetical protein
MPKMAIDSINQGIQELVEKGLLMALPANPRGDYGGLQMSIQDNPPSAAPALRG